MCGERHLADNSPHLCGGSSPRVRGTPQSLAALVEPNRFIPACAGNANRLRNPRNAATVHPRVCGERMYASLNRRRPVGSSPRVRGTQFVALSPVFGSRFIPACAGNACPPREIPPDRPVHPRVCGERNNDVPFASIGAGSSPRVRGTPKASYPKALPARFIPACAGNAWRAALRL